MLVVAIIADLLVAEELMADALAAEELMAGLLAAEELMTDAFVFEELMADLLAAEELMADAFVEFRLLADDFESRGMVIFGLVLVKPPYLPFPDSLDWLWDIISFNAPLILSSNLFVSELMVDNLESSYPDRPL